MKESNFLYSLVFEEEVVISPKKTKYDPSKFINTRRHIAGLQRISSKDKS